MSTPQRDAILAAIAARLGGIVAGATPSGSATTYNVTPAAVERCSRDWDEAVEKPWYGIVPGPAPAPEHMPFGVLRCKLPVTIVAHVNETSPTAKSERLADIEDDLLAAVNTDPTWGGLAIMTTITGLLETDEAEPDTASARGGSGTGLLRIEIEYERTIRLTA